MVLWGNHLISSVFTSTNVHVRLENFLYWSVSVSYTIYIVYLGFNEHRFAEIKTRTSSISQAAQFGTILSIYSILFIRLAISIG